MPPPTFVYHTNDVDAIFLVNLMFIIAYPLFESLSILAIFPAPSDKVRNKHLRFMPVLNDSCFLKCVHSSMSMSRSSVPLSAMCLFSWVTLG